MESVEDIAKWLVDQSRFGVCGGCGATISEDHLTRNIAAALRVERAKFAAFADENGEPRKVLGTLPLTADGYWAGSAARLFWIDNGGRVCEVSVLPSNVSDCFSTRTAAEAAKEKEPRK